jgi:hypothetical protein
LETTYESAVIETFGVWICSEEAQLLMKWKPEKLVILTQKAWKANASYWKIYFDDSNDVVNTSQSVTTPKIEIEGADKLDSQNNCNDKIG